jgi:hypothetical protein
MHGLDAAREQIAPSLGAVTYKIGANQIQSMGQGENSSFQQVLLQAPGVVQEEFGEVHVRGDHGDVQYRVNGVSLPESLNGFGQEIDTHLIQFGHADHRNHAGPVWRPHGRDY